MRQVVFILLLLLLALAGVLWYASRGLSPPDGDTVERTEAPVEQAPALQEPTGGRPGLTGRARPRPTDLAVRLVFEPSMKHVSSRVHLLGLAGEEVFTAVLAPWAKEILVESLATREETAVEVERVSDHELDVFVSGLSRSVYTVNASSTGAGPRGYASDVHFVDVGVGRAACTLHLTRSPPQGTLTAELFRRGTRVGAELRVYAGSLCVGSLHAGLGPTRKPLLVPSGKRLVVRVHAYPGSDLLAPVEPQEVVVEAEERKHLVFEAPPAARVTIRAPIRSGAPVVFGLGVWRDGPDGRPEAVTVTGNFSSNGTEWNGWLPAGRYRALALPNADVVRGWKAFEVKPKDEERLVEIPVGDDPGGVSVRIRVLEPDGVTPLASQRFNLNRVAQRLEDLDVHGGQTDADGWIRTRPLVAGTYDLIFWDLAGDFGPASSVARRVEILRHRDEFEVALERRPTEGFGDLACDVRDPSGKGASQVVVHVQKQGSPWFYLARTTHGGTLLLHHLPRGSWTVRIPTMWMRHPEWGVTSAIVKVSPAGSVAECHLQIPAR